jgi:hypothetical protein
MLTMHPEFVVDAKEKRKAVLLPFVEWERILEELEELEDIRAYDKAVAHPGEPIPFEDAVKEIRHKARK